MKRMGMEGLNLSGSEGLQIRDGFKGVTGGEDRVAGYKTTYSRFS